MLLQFAYYGNYHDPTDNNPVDESSLRAAQTWIVDPTDLARSHAGARVKSFSHLYTNRGRFPGLIPGPGIITPPYANDGGRHFSFHNWQTDMRSWRQPMNKHQQEVEANICLYLLADEKPISPLKALACRHIGDLWEEQVQSAGKNLNAGYASFWADVVRYVFASTFNDEDLMRRTLLQGYVGLVHSPTARSLPQFVEVIEEFSDLGRLWLRYYQQGADRSMGKLY